MTLFELRAALARARKQAVALRDIARGNYSLSLLAERLEKLAAELNQIENDVIAAEKIE